MANKQLRKAMDYIHEDEALTGDLADTEAKALLDWAEGQITQWLTQFESLGGTAAWKMLEPQVHALRLYLRQIAKVAARSAEPLVTLQALLAQPYAPGQSAPTQLPPAAVESPAPAPEPLPEAQAAPVPQAEAGADLSPAAAAPVETPPEGSPPAEAEPTPAESPASEAPVA